MSLMRTNFYEREANIFIFKICDLFLFLCHSVVRSISAERMLSDGCLFLKGSLSNCLHILIGAVSTVLGLQSVRTLLASTRL